jgi:hypothetical protein
VGRAWAWKSRRFDAARETALPPFHRTFIPADEVGSQAWTGGYLPVDSAEFERLLETVQTAATGTPAVGGNRERSPPPNSSATRWSAQARCDWPMLRRTQQLALDPSTRLSGARWSDDGGKPAVLHRRTDRGLWSKARSSNATGARRTDLPAPLFLAELPNCPMARFTLDAPATSTSRPIRIV